MAKSNLDQVLRGQIAPNSMVAVHHDIAVSVNPVRGLRHRPEWHEPRRRNPADVPLVRLADIDDGDGFAVIQ